MALLTSFNYASLTLSNFVKRLLTQNVLIKVCWHFLWNAAVQVGDNGVDLTHIFCCGYVIILAVFMRFIYPYPS